ncbi:MAG: SMP-30/gluconolactonase/LRE family protein [Anaerolineales bacterium]
MQPEIIHAANAALGEGPAWDAKTNTLYWIDILEKRIHFHRDGKNEFIQLDDMPGCLAPCKDGGLILTSRASIFKLKPFDRTQGKPAAAKQTLLASITEPVSNRFNDGKCDPSGRLLAGTMDMHEKAASGALYSFDGKRITQLLDGIRISNGLAWSRDYKTLYYIDTPTREIKAFDYELASGSIANMRVAFTVPETLGWPDGMTSDSQGNLWIAMWGGAQVTRWNPHTGALIEQIPLPAKNVTCPVFGGANLDELYVTSARAGLEHADLTAYRQNGSLFRLRTNVSGMPTFEFG